MTSIFTHLPSVGSEFDSVWLNDSVDVFMDNLNFQDESLYYDDPSDGSLKQELDKYSEHEIAVAPTFKYDPLFDHIHSSLYHLENRQRNEEEIKMLTQKDEEEMKKLTLSCLNPVTFEKVAFMDIFKNAKQSEEPPDLDPFRPGPMPYHPTQDHNYLKTDGLSTEKVIALEDYDEDEMMVEVWEVDEFSEDGQTAGPSVADVKDVWNKFQVEEMGPRRKSTRAAQLKQKSEARKIVSALESVKNDKVKRRRQYKNVKPKNSVETTPSQSDIEEWSNVPAKPAKPTNPKVAKKKTTKGRIDHSESERQRREVLRENFAALCELIPNKYLRGEKSSSQISKQKILTGAKAYIDVLKTCKTAYRLNLVQNKEFRTSWQNRSQLRQQIEALRKCTKKK